MQLEEKVLVAKEFFEKLNEPELKVMWNLLLLNGFFVNHAAQVVVEFSQDRIIYEGKNIVVYFTSSLSGDALFALIDKVSLNYLVNRGKKDIDFKKLNNRFKNLLYTKTPLSVSRLRRWHGQIFYNILKKENKLNLLETLWFIEKSRNIYKLRVDLVKAPPLDFSINVIAEITDRNFRDLEKYLIRDI